LVIDLIVVLASVVIIVIVFTSRARKEKDVQQRRAHVLRELASASGGRLSDALELTGTYSGYPYKAMLRETGRYESVGDGHSGLNNIQVLLLEVWSVSGESPWGFFTSLGSRPLTTKWRSTMAFSGAAGRLLSRMTPIPIAADIDERLRQAGMLECLERLVPSGVQAPYVLVSFIPAGAAAVERILQRATAAGVRLPDEARREALSRLE